MTGDTLLLKKSQHDFELLKFLIRNLNSEIENQLLYWNGGCITQTKTFILDRLRSKIRKGVTPAAAIKRTQLMTGEQEQ